jgi:tetratricopeptide (TPR) repeat protein
MAKYWPVEAKLLNQANSLVAHNQYEAAVKIYERLSSSGRGGSSLFNCYGRTLALMKRFDDAIVQQRKALLVDPNNATVINDLAVALAASKRPREAKELFLRAIELSPQYVTAYNNLGAVMMILGQYRGAVLSFQQSLALQPTNKVVSKHLSLALRAAVEQAERSSGDLSELDGAEFLTFSTELEDLSHFSPSTFLTEHTATAETPAERRNQEVSSTAAGWLAAEALQQPSSTEEEFDEDGYLADVMDSTSRSPEGKR